MNTLTNRKREEAIAAYLFMAPAMILVFLFIVMPVLLAFTYGFTDFNIIKPAARKFIGVDNFIRMTGDALLAKTFLNTLQFVVMVLPVQLVMALGLALIINRDFRYNGIFRTAYFSPAILSLVVVSLLWRTLLEPKTGLINELLGNVGIAPQPFLNSTVQAMPTIMFVSAWSGCGYQMLIFLAGLKNIDKSLYEAAQIDGAGALKRFTAITLPSLRPILLFLIITTTIQAFKLIVQPMVMTFGGPDYSTMTLLQYIFEYGYRNRNTGYASAITLVFTLFLIIVSIILKKLFREED